MNRCHVFARISWRRFGSLLLASLALLPVALPAQEGVDAQDELRQQLEQARSEMDEAARRVAELSRQLGEDRMIRIHRRGGAPRPMLGLVLGRHDGVGVLLQAVTPDGPAARAGLRSGDVVTAIDGQALADGDANQRLNDARRRLAGLSDGQQVVLEYRRDGSLASATVGAEPLAPFAVLDGLRGLDALGSLGALESLGSLEGLSTLRGLNIDIDVDQIREGLERGLAEAGRGLGEAEKRIRIIGPMLEEGLRFDAWRWQGLRLAPLDADLGRYFGSQQGALVLKAEGEVLSELRSGDVIVSVDGDGVDEPRAAMRKLAAAEPGQSLRLGVLRDRRRIELSLTAPEQPDLLRWFTPPEPPAPPAPPEPPVPPLPPPAPRAPAADIGVVV